MLLPDRSVLRGIAAGGILFIGGMMAVAAAAVISGLIAPIDTGSPSGSTLLPWMIIELAAGIPLAALSGRVAVSIGHSVRAPRILAAIVLVVGSLEVLALLSSGFVPVHSTAGILALTAPLLSALAILAGGCRDWSTIGLTWRGITHSSDMRGAVTMPVLVVTACVAIGVIGLPTIDGFDKQRIVAAALAVDLVFILPLLVYALFVRSGRLPLVSVAPVAVFGYGLAAFSIPADHDAVLSIVRWAVVPAEIAVLSVVVIRARRLYLDRAVADGIAARGLVHNLRNAARDALGSRVPAELITTEIAVLIYALRPPAEPRRAPDRYTYTVDRSVGYAAVLGGLTMAILVEAPAVHILVRQASPVAAWILTGLSCYALLWLIGDFRALRSRLTTITENRLLFRLGIRWEADIPLPSISAVDRSTASDAAVQEETFVGVLVGSPNVRIELSAPTEITGMYGLRKRASTLLVRIDNPDRFIHNLRQSIAEPPVEPWFE